MTPRSKYRNIAIGTGVSLYLCSFLTSASGGVIRSDEFNNTFSFNSGYFTDEPQFGDERPQISKFSLESEIYLDLSDRASLTISPYVQYEYRSEDNQHSDLREFLFRYSGDDWEITAGIDQIFWGVVESRNLVDTINQNDFAADFNGDAKLGQPLVSFTRFTDYGDFSFFYLPVFREPENASADTRPRLPFEINGSLTNYESSDGDKEKSYALRWSGTAGIWDLGIHAFQGTRRQPLISFTTQGFASRFITINQGGIDAQATIGALLAKVELIQQNGKEIENHTELVTGTEYTFSQFFGTGIDVGILAEYLYDSRQEQADHLFQNDILGGIRLALNDTNSTTFLLSIISDIENNGKIIQFDLDRRIGPNFTVNLGGQFWRDTLDDAILSPLNTENNLRFRLNWFF